MKVVRRSNILLVTLFAVLGLAACADSGNESAVNETAGTGVEGVEGVEGVAGVDSAGDPDAPALNGSWLSSCVPTFLGSTEYEQETVVIDGVMYERTINYYQDSDCLIPANFISFIRMGSSEFAISNSTIQTQLGTATRITIRQWDTTWFFDVDDSSMTQEDLSLFDPAIYFYNFYLFTADGRLYLGSEDPAVPGTVSPQLDESRFFTKQ